MVNPTKLPSEALLRQIRTWSVGIRYNQAATPVEVDPSMHFSQVSSCEWMRKADRRIALERVLQLLDHEEWVLRDSLRVGTSSHHFDRPKVIIGQDR